MPSGPLLHKVILVISPQSWGNMMLAKHHYAIELAKQGNEVYYLNPPDNHRWSWSRKRVKIKPATGYSNLFIIDQQLYFPYKIKFHSRNLYNLLVKRQIKKILETIPKPIDLIWSFDLGNLFPLKYFEKKLFRIFHPVDEPADKNAILAGEGADIIFSVTREILEKYNAFGKPLHFINHGLADEFIGIDSNSISSDNHTNVGLSGNLMRHDLDRKILMQIIRENPEVIFHFYGSHSIGQSNIGATEDMATSIFIKELESNKNVVFHGVLKTEELARELNRMDAFLICYDIKKDQSRGTNYHKVLEYISTGKVIIANNITTYKGMNDLVVMVSGRDNNEELPGLFRNVISQLDTFNTVDLYNKRKAFSKENTYKKQVERIASILNG